MDVGTLVEGHTLPLEIGNRFDAALCRHEYGLAGRRTWLVANVEERCTRGLRKHRWRLAGMAEINRSHVQPFEQLRARGKLRPGHLISERLEFLLELSSRAQERESAELLMCDAYNLVGRMSRSARDGANNQRESNQ